MDLIANNMKTRDFNELTTRAEPEMARKIIENEYFLG